VDPPLPQARGVRGEVEQALGLGMSECFGGHLVASRAAQLFAHLLEIFQVPRPVLPEAPPRQPPLDKEHSEPHPDRRHHEDQARRDGHWPGICQDEDHAAGGAQHREQDLKDTLRPGLGVLRLWRGEQGDDVVLDRRRVHPRRAVDDGGGHRQRVRADPGRAVQCPTCRLSGFLQAVARR